MFQQSYNHGAGCTFAATTYLANGKSPKEVLLALKHLWHQQLKWLENE